MKRFIVVGFAVLIAALASGVSTVSAQALKFGYINSQKILAEAPGASDAQKTFEQDMTRYRSEIDKMGKELEGLQGDFERQQATLSASAKQQKQQEMQTKFAAYQQRVGELERTAQRRQAELVEPIMKRISDVIEQIRKEGSYSMVFDASAGALITADPSLDLTDRVLARLRTPAR
jgi:outer membrane protein